VARNTTRLGANFELKVMHALEEYDYMCFRSSASSGAVDVGAVSRAPLYGGGKSFLAIQCKITDPLLSPAERLAVQDWALCAGAVPLVAHWAKDPETKLMRVHYRLLTGPGPKDWAHWAPGEDN
jgi:hypothetical protein